ncbi:MAG: hypothetical protein HGJ93_20510 [Desulfosarcina sp.]|nr:hypothetical protein [Desulfosarcina sp.]MBC2768231.1 hypothetical protein [Desulfosarcina sp.]
MFSEAMLVVAAVVCFTLSCGVVFAEETGTFEGTLTASGNRQILDFMEGRTVFTFSLEGHVNLKNAVGETSDFWADWVGLWDSKAGGTVRCVWDDMKGHKIYVVLNGTQLEKGATLTGEFVGGTGPFQGIQGNFIFTWTTVSFDTGDKVIAGYAKDIKGSYRLP